MIGKVFAVILILVVAMAIVICRFLKHDYAEQGIAIEGRKYRREHGGFSFDQCVKNNDFLKSQEWLRQKNKGIEPEKYKKEIKYFCHLKDCNGLVSKRGL